MTGSLVAILRRRLVLAGLLLTAINIAVISFYYVDWQGLRREKVDEQVERIAAALAPGPDGALAVVLPAELSRMFSAYPDAYAFRVQDLQGRVIAQANAQLIPAGLAPSAVPPTMRRMSLGATPGQATAAMHRVPRPDGDVFVTFASMSDPEGLTWGVFFDEIVGHVLVPLVPFALLLTLINIWTVKRSLGSLTGAAAAADRIRASGGLELLPTGGLPAEVRMLVDATNAALTRLGDALEAERAFTAEAAHALRTPLAVLSARLTSIEHGAPVEAIRADVEAMTRLVNQMLSAAQADTLVVAPDGSCDLHAVAREVVSAMAPLAVRGGRALALEGPGSAMVRGDRDAIAHALRNLIENALRHAPPGSEIIVAVEGDAVEVRDCGPGIPDADKALAVRRFWRGGDTGQIRTGLGLAIAKRIAEAHGGHLIIGDRPGGGAAVRIALTPARLAVA